jgi:hypothetical protein
LWEYVHLDVFLTTLGNKNKQYNKDLLCLRNKH